MSETDNLKCSEGGIHEKFIPSMMNNLNWFSWDEDKITVNMCKKCHLVYWEENQD